MARLTIWRSKSHTRYHSNVFQSIEGKSTWAYLDYYKFQHDTLGGEATRILMRGAGWKEIGSEVLTSWQD